MSARALWGLAFATMMLAPAAANEAAVFQIKVYSKSTNALLDVGSGFLADSSGLLVTAKHVVRPELKAGRRYEVNFGSLGQTFLAYVVQCAEDDVDLCVLHIRPRDVEVARIERPMSMLCRQMTRDEEIVSLGYPPGQMTSLNRSPGVVTGEADADYLYPTTLDIVPGWSGGPVLAGDWAIGLNAGALAIGEVTFENSVLIQPLFRAGTVFLDTGLACPRTIPMAGTVTQPDPVFDGTTEREVPGAAVTAISTTANNFAATAVATCETLTYELPVRIAASREPEVNVYRQDIRPTDGCTLGEVEVFPDDHPLRSFNIGREEAGVVTVTYKYLSRTDAEVVAALRIEARQSTVLQAAIDFGLNSSQWAFDGECDDPRFGGPGMAVGPVTEDFWADATDCAAAFGGGVVAFNAAPDFALGPFSGPNAEPGTIQIASVNTAQQACLPGRVVLDRELVPIEGKPQADEFQREAIAPAGCRIAAVVFEEPVSSAPGMFFESYIEPGGRRAILDYGFRTLATEPARLATAANLILEPLDGGDIFALPPAGVAQAAVRNPFGETLGVISGMISGAEPDIGILSITADNGVSRKLAIDLSTGLTSGAGALPSVVVNVTREMLDEAQPYTGTLEPSAIIVPPPLL